MQSNFPLAAQARGGQSRRRDAPSGATNQGPFNMKTWKYGHAFDAPPNSPIWNPVKEKMMRGEKITSVTINGNADPEVYCAAANSGVDFIWTEMQHSGGTWDGVQKMWKSCPFAKAVPGVRIPNANEFDEQHAMDLGAMGARSSRPCAPSPKRARPSNGPIIRPRAGAAPAP